MKNKALVLFVWTATALIGCGGDGSSASGQCLTGEALGAIANPINAFNMQSLNSAITAAGYQYATLGSVPKIFINQSAMQATYGQSGTISVSALVAASTPAPGST